MSSSSATQPLATSLSSNCTKLMDVFICAFLPQSHMQCIGKSLMESTPIWVQFMQGSHLNRSHIWSVELAWLLPPSPPAPCCSALTFQLGWMVYWLLREDSQFNFLEWFFPWVMENWGFLACLTFDASNWFGLLGSEGEILGLFACSNLGILTLTDLLADVLDASSDICSESLVVELSFFSGDARRLASRSRVMCLSSVCRFGVCRGMRI